jgi:hypothetical protein
MMRERRSRLLEPTEIRPTEMIEILRDSGVEVHVEKAQRPDPSVLLEPPLNDERVEKYLKR